MWRGDGVHGNAIVMTRTAEWQSDYCCNLHSATLAVGDVITCLLTISEVIA